ncbi:MAG: NTP transferase domain-containing protein [Candidatus Marinamargulisbacteria bacterium]
MKNICAIILAAGKGSRFGSDRPKVLHELHGKPMVHHVMSSVKSSGISSICLVVGYQQALVRESCHAFQPIYAVQEEQLGTGHAVVCGLNQMMDSSFETCVVLAGDCPLIQPGTIQSLIQVHTNTHAVASILTATMPDAGSYGRIIRDQDRNIVAIREAVDCTSEERAIQEFNSGIYCFNKVALKDCVTTLTANNNQNEYYLTDVIAAFRKNNQTVSGLCIDTHWEVSGANTPQELADMAAFSIEK